MSEDQPGGVRRLVEDHVAAFNAHDSARLLAGLAPDCVWRTGHDTVQGAAALADLFDDWLWSLEPSLTVRTLLTDGERAAAEITERFVVDGREQRLAKSVFFECRGGLLTRVTVYCEGSADVV